MEGLQQPTRQFNHSTKLTHDGLYSFSCFSRLRLRRVWYEMRMGGESWDGYRASTHRSFMPPVHPLGAGSISKSEAEFDNPPQNPLTESPMRPYRGAHSCADRSKNRGQKGRSEVPRRFSLVSLVSSTSWRPARALRAPVSTKRQRAGDAQPSTFIVALGDTRTPRANSQPSLD